MYEFLGAVTGRAMMKEGQPNNEAITGLIIGIAAMQATAYYTGEDVYIYWFVMLKYTAIWFFSSLVCGLLAVILGFGKFKSDFNPKSSAWPGGPHIHPMLQGIREIVSGIMAVFYPFDNALVHAFLYTNRLHMAISLGCAYIFLVFQAYGEDRRFKAHIESSKKKK